MSPISNCPFCDALVPANRFRTECPRCGKVIDQAQKPAKPASQPDSVELAGLKQLDVPDVFLPVPEPDPVRSQPGILNPLPLDELKEFETSQPKRKRNRTESGQVAEAGARMPTPGDASLSEVPAGPHSIRSAPVRHGRKSSWFGPVIMTLMAFAVVVATVWILNSVELFGTSSGKTATVAENNPNNARNNSGSDDDRTAGDRSGTPETPVAKITERPVQLHFQAQPLRYFRETEIDPCWNLVRQSVLELEVTRDGEVWFVPAVILDSRGWIVTSYSAVVGASSVVARLAPTSPDESATRRDLSASITRFVAADPEMDLVMLEVDRRMIDLIQPIQVLPRAPVAGSYLVGMGPVFDGWKRWGMETQIATSSDTSAAGKFFEHDRPASGPHPGTPLFDIQGRLAGISTAVFVEGRHRAVDSEWISKWIAQLKTRHAGTAATQPVSSLDRGLAVAEYRAPVFADPVRQPDPVKPAAAAGVATNPPPPQNTDTSSKPDTESGLSNLQRQLRQQAEACRKFAFVPTGSEELETLTEFANSLDRARVMLEIPDGADGSLGRDEWRILDRINENLRDMALESIEEVNPVRMHEANEIALKKHSEGAGTGSLVLFADTRINSMTSPELAGQPTAVMDVLGQETGVIMIVDPQRHVFRDGTRWMLFGKIPGPDTQSVKTRDNQSISCLHFELLLPVGPLR